MRPDGGARSDKELAHWQTPAHDFSSLSPRWISYVTGGLITALLGIAMMPWKLYAAAAYIFTWLPRGLSASG